MVYRSCTLLLPGLVSSGETWIRRFISETLSCLKMPQEPLVDLRFFEPFLRLELLKGPAFEGSTFTQNPLSRLSR